MPDTDEPLKLTLEEALQRLYAKGLTLIPPDGDTDSWGIGVASDSPDEEFDTWHEAVSAVLGMPVVPRDDTAELVEAVDTFLSRLEGFLDATGAALEAWENGTGPNIPIPVYSATAARLATSGDKLRAVLARVKGVS